MHLNIEIKARCQQPGKIKKILEENKAKFIGTDRQIDTYFKVKNGRLKLREGNIENALIHYDRPNKLGPKNSLVHLYKCNPDPTLKSTLTAALGVFKIVDKKRQIYSIDNVKFHLDEVQDLGSFVEIEAIDSKGNIGSEKLNKQCKYYIELFSIEEEDLINISYSDMVKTQ